jgi:hypothetical protein
LSQMASRSLDRYYLSYVSVSMTIYSALTPLPGPKPSGGCVLHHIHSCLPEDYPEPCHSHDNMLLTATLLDDFQARSSDELSLLKGDRVELVERDDDFGDGWYLGKHLMNGNTGLFPEGQ